MPSPFHSAYVITQSFGVNPEFYKPYGLIGHEGIDLIPSDSDWLVLSLRSGVVAAVIHNSPAYGNYVSVASEALNLFVYYCHLEECIATAGEEVRTGTVLGKMGSTGNTRGAHLHLGARRILGADLHNGYQGYIDPIFLLEDSMVDEDWVRKDSYERIRVVLGETALLTKARDAKLGQPTSNEIRFVFAGESYVKQEFSGGILVVKEGDWGNIQLVDW